MRDFIAWSITFGLLFLSFGVIVISVETESYFLLYLGVTIFFIGTAIPISRMFGKEQTQNNTSQIKDEATEQLFGYTLIRNADYKHLCNNTDELFRLQSKIRKQVLDQVALDEARRNHFDRLLQLNQKLETKEITYTEYDGQFREECVRFNNLLVKYGRTD